MKVLVMRMNEGNFKIDIGSVDIKIKYSAVIKVKYVPPYRI